MKTYELKIGRLEITFGPLPKGDIPHVYCGNNDRAFYMRIFWLDVYFSKTNKKKC